MRVRAETSPIEIQINSNTGFYAFARYHDEDGNPLASGPLPPKVGQTTTYRVFWEVRNSLHDLHKGSTTANLPPGIIWTGNSASDIGTIIFDETTRLVTWNIDGLPASIPRVGAWFDVSVTPQSSDVGTFVKLINPIAFEITDKETDDTIHASTPILDTEIPQDQFAKGKGTVEE